MSTATTPAEELRRAASLMRGRAGAASPGPWHHMCMGSEGCQVINDGHLRERKHVSLMHPLVAVAVADWLEVRARDAEDAREAGDGGWSFGFCDDPAGIGDALKVARAYLGGASGQAAA